MRDQRPIFLALELLDLEFAVTDEPQGHRLHAAGRFCAGQLAPQHGRQIEADQIIQRAAGQIGLDQRIVNLARMFHRFEDRILGDGVEDHALDRLVLEHLLVAENLQHMPRNGLALAIRIGRQNDLVGVFDESGDVGQALAGLGVDIPQHFEIVVRIDGAILGRQIAHMPEGGDHFVILAKIFVDRLGLGRRFDDDDVHAISSGRPKQGFRRNVLRRSQTGRKMG